VADTLSAGGIELPLEPTAAGPLVATGAAGELEALGWLVNMALHPGEEDLAERLRRGEAAGVREGPYARPPSDLDDDLAQARERWRRLSGHAAPDDALIVGTGWSSPRLLVPRAVILALIDELAKLRRSDG
jgi:hypothetical protein